MGFKNDNSDTFFIIIIYIEVVYMFNLPFMIVQCHDFKIKNSVQTKKKKKKKICYINLLSICLFLFYDITQQQII
jgi:hypothetical protein